MRGLVATLFAVSGAGLAAVAGIGLLRLRGFFARIHVATKPGVLGLVLVAIAAVVAHPSVGLASRLLLVIAFQLMTAPVAAHMIGRAAYTKRIGREDLLRNDLGADRDELDG
ncbi:MAG: Na+/H+ antiporter subunit G [Acidobacteria bacterium]|nr:MAG: Na+/H+ antiporter subunit G [Acidobacteriota bacterium]